MSMNAGNGYNVGVVAHTEHPYGGVPLTTLACTYPRFIHAQILTHRAFSRNASSNRALPFEVVAEQVERNPAMPLKWQKDKRGMVGGRVASDKEAKESRLAWIGAAANAITAARQLNDIGVHHGVTNRILEPFQWITTIITATEWDNFFKLRCADDAQPEIQHLATLMRDAVLSATPTHAPQTGWHVPFYRKDTHETGALDYLLVAAGRCARVSYLHHDGTADGERDLLLALRLLKNGHWSPFEHVARPDERGMDGGEWLYGDRHANFNGWVQLRHMKTLECIAGDHGIDFPVDIEK